MNFRDICRAYTLLILSGILASGTSLAADLKLGVAGYPNTIDPQVSNDASTKLISRHLFDTLVQLDPTRGILVPQLATSWRNIDPLTWEFSLRRGVKFHDGSDFTADDVLFSLNRIDALAPSANSFKSASKLFVERSIVDPYTIRLKTAEPTTSAALSISNIFILPKSSQATSTDDFNAGRGVIGTGPFRFVQWQRPDRVELQRNPDYWDVPSIWERVSVRALTTAQARVTALLSGEVDAITAVPAHDVAQLKARGKLHIAAIDSINLQFIQLDLERSPSPFLSTHDGKPLANNPFKDLRVRQALSMAIDRVGIAERVMEGQVIPAAQLVPAGQYGASATLQVTPYDPQGAKKLLAEAGYPEGFAFTLHCNIAQNNTAEKVYQAVAQMWARIGIKATVQGAPISLFMARMQKRDMSAQAFEIGGATTITGFLVSLLTTHDAEHSLGSLNFGRYSNPQLDALVYKARATFDVTAAEVSWRAANELAIKDLGLIPLVHAKAIWAMRDGLRYQARKDGVTVAWGFTPVTPP